MRRRLVDIMGGVCHDVSMKVIAFVLLILGMLFGVGGVTAAQEAQSPDDAVMQDAASYAEFAGVSLDVAMERFSASDDIRLLRQELIASFGDDFADLWIDNDPYGLTILLEPSGSGQVAAVEALANEMLPEITPARVLVTETPSAVLDQIASDLISWGVTRPYDVSVDVKQRLVTVWAASYADVADPLRQFGLEDSPMIDLVLGSVAVPTG